MKIIHLKRFSLYLKLKLLNSIFVISVGCTKNNLRMDVENNVDESDI